MGKFKNGVRVRLIERHDGGGPEIGALGTICAKGFDKGDRDVVWDGLTDGHSGEACDGSTNHWYVPKSKLEVVVDEPTEETWVPKVGDRVVWAGHWQPTMYTTGKEYEIHNAEGSTLYVTDDTDERHHSWSADSIVKNFTLVQPLPVAAEAQLAGLWAPVIGKYGKTRSGEKVGPIVASGDKKFPFIDLDRMESWRADGTWALDPAEKKPLDLVAEWVDEPVVAVAPATATLKAGDRVALNDSAITGGSGTLVRIDEAGDYLVAIDGYTDGHDGDLGDGSRSHRWFFGGEGVSRLEEPAPAQFKVGDRVIGDCGFSFDPAEGVVTSVNDGWIGVKVPSHHEPDYEWAYPTEAVRLITAEPANDNTVTLTLKVDSEPVADALRTIAAALNRAANEIAA